MQRTASACYVAFVLCCFCCCRCRLTQPQCAHKTRAVPPVEVVKVLAEVGQCTRQQRHPDQAHAHQQMYLGNTPQQASLQAIMWTLVWLTGCVCVCVPKGGHVVLCLGLLLWGYNRGTLCHIGVLPDSSNYVYGLHRLFVLTFAPGQPPVHSMCWPPLSGVCVCEGL